MPYVGHSCSSSSSAVPSVCRDLALLRGTPLLMVLVLSSSPFRASPSSVAIRQPAVRWFWKFCLFEILHFDLLSTPPRSSSLSLLLFPLAPSASRSSVFCVSLLPRPPLSRSLLSASLLCHEARATPQAHVFIYARELVGSNH